MQPLTWHMPVVLHGCGTTIQIVYPTKSPGCVNWHLDALARTPEKRPARTPEKRPGSGAAKGHATHHATAGFIEQQQPRVINGEQGANVLMNGGRDSSSLALDDPQPPVGATSRRFKSPSSPQRRAGKTLYERLLGLVSSGNKTSPSSTDRSASCSAKNDVLAASQAGAGKMRSGGKARGKELSQQGREVTLKLHSSNSLTTSRNGSRTAKSQQTTSSAADPGSPQRLASAGTLRSARNFGARQRRSLDSARSAGSVPSIGNNDSMAHNSEALLHLPPSDALQREGIAAGYQMKKNPRQQAVADQTAQLDAIASIAATSHQLRNLSSLEGKDRKGKSHSAEFPAAIPNSLGQKHASAAAESTSLYVQPSVGSARGPASPMRSSRLRGRASSQGSRRSSGDPIPLGGNIAIDSNGNVRIVQSSSVGFGDGGEQSAAAPKEPNFMMQRYLADAFNEISAEASKSNSAAVAAPASSRVVKYI